MASKSLNHRSSTVCTYNFYFQNEESHRTTFRILGKNSPWWSFGKERVFTAPCLWWEVWFYCKFFRCFQAHNRYNLNYSAKTPEHQLQELHSHETPRKDNKKSPAGVQKLFFRASLLVVDILCTITKYFPFYRNYICPDKSFEKKQKVKVN